MPDTTTGPPRYTPLTLLEAAELALRIDDPVIARRVLDIQISRPVLCEAPDSLWATLAALEVADRHSDPRCFMDLVRASLAAVDATEARDGWSEHQDATEARDWWREHQDGTDARLAAMTSRALWFPLEVPR